MLMSAGIIPALVQTLGNQNPAHVKVIVSGFVGYVACPDICFSTCQRL